MYVKSFCTLFFVIILSACGGSSGDKSDPQPEPVVPTPVPSEPSPPEEPIVSNGRIQSVVTESSEGIVIETESFTYNDKGQLIEINGSDNNTNIYEYDELGRITKLVSTDPDDFDEFIFSYDGSNVNPASATHDSDNNGVTYRANEQEFQYDAQGKLLSTSIKSINYLVDDEIISDSSNEFDSTVTIDYSDTGLISNVMHELDNSEGVILDAQFEYGSNNKPSKIIENRLNGLTIITRTPTYGSNGELLSEEIYTEVPVTGNYTERLTITYEDGECQVTTANLPFFLYEEGSNRTYPCQ